MKKDKKKRHESPPASAPVEVVLIRTSLFMSQQAMWDLDDLANRNRGKGRVFDRSEVIRALVDGMLEAGISLEGKLTEDELCLYFAEVFRRGSRG